jgi:hypothetical protein
MVSTYAYDAQTTNCAESDKKLKRAFEMLNV